MTAESPPAGEVPVTAEARVRALAARVPRADRAAGEAARRRSDGLRKPPGSLGALEDVAARLAAIAGACPPPIPAQPAVVVAAADHGVWARGVSPWPQEVTAAMVASFCTGDAAVNAVAAAVGARIAVLDVGVAGALPEHPRLRRARVRAGTADLSRAPAMTRAEAAAALLAGAELAAELVAGGADLLVTGDMGIANTTAAACLIAAFTGAPPQAVTGRGAAGDDGVLAHKTAVVAEALARHAPDPADPLGVLAAVGGLEHAAIAGVLLAGAAARVPLVLDGMASVAAALVAVALAPALGERLLAGTRSPEPGASVALAALHLAPLLDLGLRLGEGTGGLLAVPLVVASAHVLAEMGTLKTLIRPADEGHAAGAGDPAQDAGDPAEDAGGPGAADGD